MVNQLPFYKVHPGGNPTVLIMSPAPVEPEKSALARRIMADSHLGCEQVGFVDQSGPIPRLEMMGGEFCGNAARSLAAVLAFEQGGKTETMSPCTGRISVSGAPEPLEFAVEKSGRVRVQMPLPARREQSRERTIIHLPGIAHVLLDEAEYPFPNDWMRSTRNLLQTHGLDRLPAAGCIWYRLLRDKFTIRPCVLVTRTGSVHAETACGSGSLALALGLGLDTCSIVQPSGHALTVEIERNEQSSVSRAWIKGPVDVVAWGTVLV